jgi:ketosteroid isomerase-like protein
MGGKSMRKLCYAFALAAGCAGPALAHVGAKQAATQPGSLHPSAKAAASVVDAFHAALRRGDLNAALALLSDDALIFESGGVERSKAEYRAEHLPADAEFTRAVPSKLVRRSGRTEGDTAWIASEGRVTGTFKGKPLDRITTETMVLRRDRAGWKIVHIHWSSSAAP